ncbi:hypothetical protein [Pseudomonas extremaustralis]
MTKVKNMIWKRLNFTGVKSKTKGNILGTNQLTKSLEHSLRLVQKHGMEFNLDLKMNNLIVHNNKIIELETLSKDERRDILKSIVEPAIATSESKQLSTVNNSDLSKYSYKLKQLAQKKESPELTTLLESILTNKNEPIDKGETLAQLELLTLKRKEQKKSCLSTYIDLHNSKMELSKPIPDNFHKKRTVVQEAFWKFPFNQNVDNIKPAHYINTINSFYKEHFPDYPIKLIVFHGDEISSPDDNGLAVHPHILIDGKNSKTNKYDIIDQEFRMVNKFRGLKGLEPLDRHDGKYSTAVQLGVDYQEMIYKHVNENLAKYNYDISVEIIPDSPEKKARNRLIKKDTSQPKIDRVYNSISRGTEQKAKLDNELNSINERTKKAANAISELSENFKLAKSNYSEQLDEFKTAEKKKIDTNLKEYRADEIKKNDEYIKEQLNFIDRISSMFKSISDFVEVCVNRTWKMDTKRPTKEKVIEVNKRLDEMYKALPTSDGKKIINDYLDEQNKSLEKYDVEASFKPKKLNPSRRTLKLH